MIFSWCVKRAIVASLLTLTCAANLLAADEVLLNAKRALDQGRAQAAYDALNPLQQARAGDPAYDFLLGRAALELGRNTEAVFALERVLAVLPGNGPARARIAQAYFNLQETETARREFENVQKQEVPPEVSAAVARFLEAIERAEQGDQPVVHGYFQLSLGHDSNVNSATAEKTVAVPLFGGPVTLSDASTKQSDQYVSFGAGVNFRDPLTNKLGLVGGLNFATRSNYAQSSFDTVNYDFNLGLSYKDTRDTLTGTLNYGNLWVSLPEIPNAYRVVKGLIGEWQHDYDKRNQTSLFLQAARLEYPDQQVLDAARLVLGAGYAHALQSGPIVYLGWYGGRERQQDDTRPDLGFRLIGARTGGQVALAAAWTALASVSYERRRYAGDDPFFFTRREDRQSDASLGLRYAWLKNASVSAQLSYTQNNSNIQLHQFARTQYWLGIRQEF